MDNDKLMEGIDAAMSRQGLTEGSYFEDPYRDVERKKVAAELASAATKEVMKKIASHLKTQGRQWSPSKSRATAQQIEDAIKGILFMEGL